ncbi:mannose-6-phosphate isomerase, class I [Nesterenkonia muleiensis]|uniref:mannose-6-phosphate isomerase, class I n=1 Tax=Nesterenkonia muleiensis TaxID=2282648 RepID=UPI000E72677D|nr:mannose-6-phosphate isomerase, class I [Nesterenkonia muleiensis]
MYRLENHVRDYGWGAMTAIAELTGRDPSGRPEAELWIGAHPGSPSVVVHPPARQGRRLDELIAEAAEHHLGSYAASRFGRLPFLTKVLAAAAPLSLQVHPTEEQARAGYARERTVGLHPADPGSNYKDEHHKPEMLLALTDFVALCGFRQPREAAEDFHWLARSANMSMQAADEAGALATRLEAGDLTGVFADLLGGPAREVTGGVQQLVAAAPAAVAEAAAAASSLAEVPDLAGHYPGDPGVVISLLLNLVRLAPGQAIALPAGNVHAYLRGVGVEVMAASDNVLRGGLTPKHVDVAELLKTVDFRPLPIPYVEPEPAAGGTVVFRPGFAEFQLQRLDLDPGQAAPIEQHGPAIILCTEGAAEVHATGASEVLVQGESLFLPAEWSASAGEITATAVPADHSKTGLADGMAKAEGTTLFAVTLPPH